MGQVNDMLRNRLMGGGVNPAPANKDDLGISPEAQKVVNDFRAIQMTRAMFGDDKIRAAAESDPKVMSEIIKSNTTMVTSMMQAILDAKKDNPSIGNDPYVKKLEEEVKELKGAMAGGGDQIDTYLRMNSAIRTYVDQMGLGHPAAPAPAPDGVIMLQIRKMDQESEERKHQWEVEKEEREDERLERRRQWQMEYDQREEAARLHRMEFQESRDRKEKATGVLSDMVTALAGGIVPGAAGAEAAGMTVSKKVAAPIFQFKCENPDCGTVIGIYSPNQTEAICPRCGAAYNTNPGQTKPAAPAAPPTAQPAASMTAAEGITAAANQEVEE